MCVGAGDPRRVLRAHYLAKFIPKPAWRTTLYVHADVTPDAVDSVRDRIERIHELATKHVGLTSDPPVIYIYPTAEALREFACTGPSAVAYYDGAIHLAVVAGGDSELARSLRHEYVHHVLVSNGIGAPIWFQEGAAMAFAADGPRNYYQTWRKNPIHVEQMITTFPSTQPEEAQELFYVKAFVMTEFLERLCLARTNCGIAELAAALESGRVSADDLFDWAAHERSSDLAHTALRSIWEDYAAHGNFPPATMKALLDRASVKAANDERGRRNGP